MLQNTGQVHPRNLYILLALQGFEEMNTVWNITIENIMKVAPNLQHDFGTKESTLNQPVIA